MSWLVVNAVDALTLGLLLFLLSAGLTVAFGLMGVLSFAHGALYALGAYLGWQVAQVGGFWLALMVAPAAVGLTGIGIERWALQRVRARGHLAELLATAGIGYVIAEVIPLVWGRSALEAYAPVQLATATVDVFGARLSGLRLTSAGLALGVLAALALVLRATRISLVLRAALTHAPMVSALGVDLNRVHALVFGGSCALAGLAGVLGGNLFLIEPAMAYNVTGLAFAIIVIGGLGSLGGAFAASMIVAALLVFPAASTVTLAGMPISRFAAALPYLALVVALATKPAGLFGDRS